MQALLSAMLAFLQMRYLTIQGLQMVMSVIL